MTCYNHCGPGWRGCPICGRRTHMEYTAYEYFQEIRSEVLKAVGKDYAVIEVRCERCRLSMTEGSNGRKYAATVYALKNRWNTRGEKKRGRKAAIPG